MPYLGNVPSSFNVGTDNINNDAITTAKIADGAILNADVNAAAAIAGTKISPDFGSQNILTTGTATAASLIPTSSTVPTNGLYLPAANSVAISTGGSGRLFINSSGKIGVNTSAPSSQFSVGSDTSAPSVISLDYNPTNTTAASISANHSTGEVRYGAVAAYFPTFYSNNLERLRITSAGLVGIGTSAPTEILTVSKAEPANTFPFHIENTQNWGWGVGLKLRQKLVSGASVTDSAAIVSDWDGDNNSTLEFYTVTSGSLTEKVRITSVGRVGIGTSSPVYMLDIRNDSAAQAVGANFIDTNAAGRSYSIRSDVGKFQIRDVTAAADRITLDSSGRVGIGSTSPDANLTLGGLTNTGGQSVDALNVNRTDGLRLFGIKWDVSSNEVRFSGNTKNYVFRNGSSEAETARIDSSGRLLVGTSSAIAALEPSIQTARSSGAFLALGRDDTSITDDELLGAIYFYGNQGSSWSNSARIEAKADAAWGTNDYPSKLVFSTTADGASSPTERMRISSIGVTNVFISSGDGIQARNAAAASTSYANFVGRYGATDTITSGTVSFIVYTNGDVKNTNNSYTAISDVKLKENIVDANSQWDDIKALRVRNFTLKEGQTHKQIGLIAQEVEPICPGLVGESPDRDAEGNDLGTVTKSVNYSVLYMKAVKALQEAMERIEQLEAEMAEVKSQLS